MPEPSWQRVAPEGEEILAENWLFRVRRERFRSRRSEKTHDHYVIEIADGVLVIAVTPERRVVLVEQFRGGSKQDSLEPPGGLVDRGENVLAAAARELEEETGYRGDPPVLLGTCWMNPAVMTSRISLVLIENAKRESTPRPDHGEELRMETVPATRVPRLIQEGKIDHAIAVWGLLTWMASEMPGNPLGRSSGARRGILPRSIAAIMITVLGFAFLATLVRSAGMVTTLVLAGAFSWPISAVLVWRIDPPPRSVLSRPGWFSIRRRALRSLASIGLAALIVGLVRVIFHFAGLP
jgi:8-oxo-dGTP pyrophosphatase MutT (NUDIX family)